MDEVVTEPVSDLKYWVAFNRVRRLGPIRLRRIEAHFGDLALAWMSSQSDLASVGLDKSTVREIVSGRPEIDPERIFACGSSQGGGLTLITAALRPEIKAGVAGYPFLCCYPEAMAMFRSYPYDELACYARAYPEEEERMLDTLRYFDAVNFAPRIKSPMVVGIALDDEVCPPETSYAAYRALTGHKELWLFPNSGHGNAHDYPGQERAWLESQIALTAVVS